MVFFFGGGWNEGNRLQFAPQANYFATRGIVCFLVDYRVKSRNGTTPFDALMDAKSAIRFIREHSHRFKIDPGKVIAAGGSAGGQLAAATALIAPHNDPQDNSLISCVPNALVLFNPVIDNGPGNRTFNSVGSGYKDFSPLHNISKGAPPTIIFQGTDDAYTPVKTIEYYQLVMQHVGSRCDLHLYAEQKHGFFNLSRSELFFKRTVIETDKFLSSLGLTHGSPTISE
jgi:acetyl esterase/lipase